ncbi:unnamed protein product [Sympodiomycopsis kandeliae]
MSLAALGICAGSIYTFFLLWALLQERLTTTPYNALPANGIFTKQGEAEYFRSPLLLNWMQASFSTLIAAGYLLCTADAKDRRSILDKFGLAALTPAGAARVRKTGANLKDVQQQQQNGYLAHERTSSNSISPLLLRYLLISSLQSCSSQLGLHSLAHGISYPTLTLAKSCKLVPVLLMNVILYRRKFPLYKYMVVAAVTAGISMFMLFSAESEKKRAKGGGKGDSLVGLALLSLNLIFDGATNSTQDDVFHKYSVSGPQMMLVMNGLSSLLMGASLVLPLHQLPLIGALAGSGAKGGGSSELSSALAFIGRHPQVVRDLVAYAAAGAIGQVAIFETLQRFGSLTLVSITVTRKLFTMLLSLVVYSHRLTTLQRAGVALVFVGLGVEAHKKRQEGLMKKVLQQRDDRIREDKKAGLKDA